VKRIARRTTLTVDEFRKRKTIEENSGGAAPDRRRIGVIRRDERDQASVEWCDAPEDYERPVLKILGGELALKNDASYDPYAHPVAAAPGTSPGNTTRTNLRKLSEWIKMKRALEERKLRGGADGEDDES
jgi:hypothetical protein